MKLQHKLSVQEYVYPSDGDLLRPLPDKELALRSARLRNYRNGIFLTVYIILVALQFGA